MIETLREAAGEEYWVQWENIRCPTLVVRAGDGLLPEAEAREMIDRLPTAQGVELHNAEHDLHLDRPIEWRRSIIDFLDEVQAFADE